MTNDDISKRFTELLTTAQRPVQSDPKYVDGGWFNRWASSSQNLIGLVFGRESDHYQNFTAHMKKFNGWKSGFDYALGVLQSAFDDWQRGFYRKLEVQITGEVFGDFVALAKESLNQGHKDVAAVLAAAALEDALKRFAKINGLDLSGKTMDTVVGALKGAGLVSGAQKSLLDVMPRIRNAAMHADFAKISDADVGSILGFTEQFLLTKFS
jgi:hypothetical protein